MLLGAFHLDGQRAKVLPAYEALMLTYPADSRALHVCVLYRK